MIERERRFLLRSLGDVPAALLEGAVGVEITQCYLVASAQVAVRIRTEQSAGVDTHTLTIKLPTPDDAGSLGAAERVEVEFEITPTQAAELRRGCGGRVLHKTRTRVPLGAGLVAEIDVFAGEWDGLAMMEVEFASPEALMAFNAPGWCGAEVTADGRFTNAALASADAVARGEVLAAARAGAHP